MGILAKNTSLSQLLATHAAALAGAEHLDVAALTGGIDAGRMVLLANPAHSSVIPTVVG